MSKGIFPAAELRRAFDDIPEEVAHHGIDAPDARNMYVVAGHESALNPDTALVVGDRGTGKSFWCAALNGPTTKLLIDKQLRRLRLEEVHVSWGYSSDIGNEQHPSRRVLRQLLSNGFRAEDIWRTVILSQLLRTHRIRFFADAHTWGEKCQKVADRPEDEEQLFADLNSRLSRDGSRHLIVFDALDRLGENWAGIRELLQGLLRVGLDLRGYRAIRTKFFLRPDMWEDKRVWAFPDASKLQHGLVRLQWRRSDLYGLLWHYLGNHEHSGLHFRKWINKEFGYEFAKIEVEGITVAVVPESLRKDEKEQARVLNALASPFMGRDRRRGKTYTWLPTHLADAKGQISPRSFLLALKKAEKVTRERFADQSRPLLHYDGIKQGVQEASRIRLQELQEDYPWISMTLEPLRGMTVPCEPRELRRRWRDNRVVDSIRTEVESWGSGDSDESARPYLPPHGLEQASGSHDPEAALIDAAVEIGVMNETADGRINIPDLFRVAAGIGRKGGVRAIK